MQTRAISRSSWSYAVKRRHLSELGAHAVELAFHAGDFAFARLEGVCADRIRFPGFDTAHSPVVPVAGPMERKAKHLGRRRDPLFNRRAGGARDGALNQLAQFGERNRGVSRH